MIHSFDVSPVHGAVQRSWSWTVVDGTVDGMIDDHRGRLWTAREQGVDGCGRLWIWPSHKIVDTRSPLYGVGGAWSEVFTRALNKIVNKINNERTERS